MKTSGHIMALLWLLAAVATTGAAASGVDQTKGTCLLQHATMSTKKVADVEDSVKGVAEPEAASEHAVVHDTEKDSIKPVLPKPLVLLSDIVSENKSAASENKSMSVLRPRRGSGMAHVIMGDYPGYTGELKVRGTVAVSTFVDSVGEMMLQWNLDGTDSLCGENASNPAKNACGIHIHEGMLCSNEKLVGGHFYLKAAAPAGDPWAHFTYTATGTGRSEGASSVFIGLSLADVMARSVVVHDHTGARIACGLIFEKSGAAAPRSALALLLALFTTVFWSR
mmetsp:Transcript_114805/g.214904  ORF Transcript_114805/g.214904 Transcript_114805/m.214904 type:complete len:281 (-) Transcript_114805:127-969(-)